jgi:hypothetical protein
VGVLEKNAAGKLAITRVTLRPRIVWSAGVYRLGARLPLTPRDAP